MDIYLWFLPGNTHTKKKKSPGYTKSPQFTEEKNIKNPLTQVQKGGQIGQVLFLGKKTILLKRRVQKDSKNNSWIGYPSKER